MLPKFELYSHREARLQKTQPEVYKYDELPEKLRVQICHIMTDAIGQDQYQNGIATKAYQKIYDLLCRECGVFQLAERRNAVVRHDADIANFLMAAESVTAALDIVQCIFIGISEFLDETSHYDKRTYTLDPHEAIEALNARFKEHSVGFEFISNTIIRIDSHFVHSEIIKPALLLLAGDVFQGPNEEFLKAHSHYRSGNYKECLIECLKAFESTIKTIGKARHWVMAENATASKLVEACFTNNLLPTYLTTQIGSIRSFFDSVATLRNRNAGHGQGESIVEVDAYIAKHSLNMAAMGIVFLVDAHVNTE